jgi:hypothetical protein
VLDVFGELQARPAHRRPDPGHDRLRLAAHLKGARMMLADRRSRGWAISVLAAITCACGGAPASDSGSAPPIEFELPSGDQPPGWTLVAGPERYEVDTLWEYINGQADFFIDYGFEQVDTAEYEHAAEALSVVVEVYRMGRPQEAFGIFAAERTREDQSAEIGAGAFVGSNTLGFWQGSHYAKVTTFEDGPAVEPLMLAMAREISSRLPDGPSKLRTLGLFPDDGLVSGSERFIPKNFLGQPYLAEVYRVDTVQSGQEFQLFIVEAATPTKAISHFESLAEFYLGRQPDVTSVDASTQPPLLLVDGESKLVVFELGHRLAGAMGMQDIETGRKAAAALAASLSEPLSGGCE